MELSPFQVKARIEYFEDFKRGTNPAGKRREANPPQADLR